MTENGFERPSLTEIAYEEIRNSICLGKFAPGYKLVVDELIKTYNISNTPIKEALNRLVAEGLVETVPRRGMQVKTFGPQDIIEVNDMRFMYESFCARKAVKVIDDRPDSKAKLLAKMQQMEELTEQHASYNYVSHIKIDQAFHLTLISLAENEMLMKEYKKLRAINMAFNNYIYRDLPLKRGEAALREHRLIYEALINKDESLLVKNLEQHIENVKNDMLGFMTNELNCRSAEI